MELSPEHHEHPSILEGDAFPTPNSVDQAVNSISTDGRARIIDKPSENDVLTGRGASINANPGNKKFRALCFARKALFDAGNHAAKRRVANEIVTICIEKYGSRFLRREEDNSLSSHQRFWCVMTKEQAILKASQVMRDYKRPDRLAQRELMAAQGRRRKKFTTPMDDVDMPLALEAPLVENPLGVNSNDVLCGRGAFANDHSGNKRLRALAIERKARFEAGNYNEKKMLASEIVKHIGSLSPPGRFLKRIPPNQKVDPADPLLAVPPTENDHGWFRLEENMAVQKACQVMRDIARPDRHERDEKRRLRRLMKVGSIVDNAVGATVALLGSPADTDLDIVDDAVEVVEAAIDKNSAQVEEEHMIRSDVDDHALDQSLKDV